MIGEYLSGGGVKNYLRRVLITFYQRIFPAKEIMLLYSLPFDFGNIHLTFEILHIRWTLLT